ncbi:hypothetical protein [Thioalkalivibrio sp. ALM2T]|uniref:hypothetical protein n=1 Tax=Thioalkalivibrio sp. ALM2T TaxID=1158184 RepID=UPI000365FAE7|nr:hypothetical protein [Thioalkalivibrio sp. ALM2T]
MRTTNRHTWLHALLVLSLVLAVPLLQGAGLHLHVGDAHHSSPHAAHDSEHTHHHDESAEVDLTPQATTGKPVTVLDLPGAALPTTAGDLSVAAPRAPPRIADRTHPLRASPPWLAPPLRGPPA